MAERGDYRVREAVVDVCNGYTSHRERMFIAERRVGLFGLAFWCPVDDGGWRYTADEAMRDIERDAYLRAPLAEPVILHAG